MNIKRKYRLETKRIETKIDAEGNENVSWASLDCRVVDDATGMPIGLVLHVHAGDEMRFEAYPLYTNSGEPLVPPHPDGWGPRFYEAAGKLWVDWNKTLPLGHRFSRCIRRWLAVYWWFFGVAVGIGSALLVPVVLKWIQGG